MSVRVGDLWWVGAPADLMNEVVHALLDWHEAEEALTEAMVANNTARFGDAETAIAETVAYDAAHHAEHRLAAVAAELLKVRDARPVENGEQQ